jgi:peptide-methionine (S)-S-oxide reductase
MTKVLETATLGGGCFWCVEAVIQKLKGVESVISGYCNGDTNDPTYKDICTGTTGHAEVVQIKFDPSVISYSVLLEVFFTTHDPTTLNQQGADRGTQYRSIVVTHSEEQLEQAQVVKTKMADIFDSPIVTEITPLEVFYPAEEYHQNYYEQNKNQGYCVGVISPKVAKLRMYHAEKLR